jgi:hypothetical protein
VLSFQEPGLEDDLLCYPETRDQGDDDTRLIDEAISAVAAANGVAPPAASSVHDHVADSEEITSSSFAMKRPAAATMVQSTDASNMSTPVITTKGGNHGGKRIASHLMDKHRTTPLFQMCVTRAGDDLTPQTAGAVDVGNLCNFFSCQLAFLVNPPATMDRTSSSGIVPP